MNDLIIANGTEERFLVSGRMLHEKLAVKTLYKDWIPRMVEYGFVENADFNPLKNERVQLEGGREVTREITDHLMSIDMAKHICMIQRTSIGMQIRQHLIDIEAAWNTPEAIMARALQIQQRIVEDLKGKVLQLEAKTQEDAPRVRFAQAVEGSKDGILIRELAKLLAQNGIDIGEHRLFDKLRTDGYLIRKYGRDKNAPTQKAIDLGLFTVRESVTTDATGETHTHRTTLVTGHGQLYFINKYSKTEQVIKEDAV